MSKPFNYFRKSTERAERLIALATDRPDEQDDLLRAGAVLAVAAYDHYFTSKFCDVMASYLKNNRPNAELIDLLDRAGLKAKTALELAVMKRPFRRIRTFLASSLS